MQCLAYLSHMICAQDKCESSIFHSFSREMFCIAALVLFLPILQAETFEVEDIIIRPTKVPEKCHNKIQETRRSLMVKVKYDLFLLNGALVHSVDELHFKYGSKSVMPGLNEGIFGMCEGEERFLSIPSAKAYGQRGLENKVPPNENVILKIELLEVLEHGFTTAEKDFQDADLDGNLFISPEEFQEFHNRALEEMRQGMESQSIPDIQEILQRFQGENALKFESEDVNEDGFIDFSEFTRQHFEL